MSEPRARRPSDLDAPAAARSTSLRRSLWFGVTLCLVLGIGAFAIVVHRVIEVADARDRARDRYTSAARAHQDRMTAILEQELAAEAYQVTHDADLGEAYERARQDEIDATIALERALDVEQPEDLAGAAALDAALARWRTSVWEPPASRPPLAGIRDVTAAHRVVAAELDRRARAELEDHARDIRITIVAAVVLILLGGTFAVTMVIWILRRTARPLEQLSRLALDGQAFPAPGDGEGVREVDTLAWALHELDLAVRDREERLAEAHAEAVELSRFGEHVQQIVDEAELHDALAKRLVAVSDAHAAVTLVHAPAHGRLEVASSTREPRERIDLPILDEPAKCRAVRTLRTVIADAASPTACRCALVPEGGSYLCAPMLAASELVGVVALQAGWKAHFTDRIQKRVHASLGFGATALASLRLLAATRERALRDPLTGAYNRAFLAEYLDKHLALADRRGTPLGVLAVDLDHFKRLNDTHGHAAGDRALLATVEAIQREVRASDAVVRHGGEEIVVVLVDTDLAAATEVAERIRRGIEGIVLETDHGTAAVRASIGVAAFPDHGQDQLALLAAADRALYQAKDAGRNRVITAPRRDDTPATPPPN